MSPPVICFGQQPCGFFPRRFLWAKMVTARRLQSEIGGEIVYFCHDSDHDPRETQTILRNCRTGAPQSFNFTIEGRIQRKFSPLHLKRIAPGWRDNTARQLPAFVDRKWADVFRAVDSPLVADFCLEMYQAMGLLDGVRVVRSSDPAVRRAACGIGDCFVDVPYQGEIVRARLDGSRLRLHEGGGSFVDLPSCEFDKTMVSPTRDTRLRWMQSVIHCTHYVCGASEQNYLDKTQAPEITYIVRDPIDRSDEAYVETTM